MRRLQGTRLTCGIDRCHQLSATHHLSLVHSHRLHGTRHGEAQAHATLLRYGATVGILTVDLNGTYFLYFHSHGFLDGTDLFATTTTQHDKQRRQERIAYSPHNNIL